MVFLLLLDLINLDNALQPSIIGGNLSTLNQLQDFNITIWRMHNSLLISTEMSKHSSTMASNSMATMNLSSIHLDIHLTFYYNYTI